jgi:hypothetical protein
VHSGLVLFVKSLILWEGFKDSYTPRLGLQRVKELFPKKKDKLNRMATELIEKIERPYLPKIDGEPD